MITATDAVVLAGVNPYASRTPLSVYAEKVGPPQPRSKTSRAMWFGNMIEPIALQYLREERKLTVLAGTETLRHPILTHIGATPDGTIIERHKPVAVAECKAVGFDRAPRWGEEEMGADGVPEDVLVQVHMQMTVRRVNLAYVVALLGTDARIYVVERNEDLATALLETCDEFWRKHVVPRVPPTPDGSEASSRAIGSLFPKTNRQHALAPAEAERWAEAYLAAKDGEARAAAAKAEAEAELKLLCGDAQGLVGPTWRLDWMNRKGSPAWKAIAEAMQPPAHIIAEHTPAVGPRVFSLKEK